jgi:hypothetical protein
MTGYDGLAAYLSEKFPVEWPNDTTDHWFLRTYVGKYLVS